MRICVSLPLFYTHVLISFTRTTLCQLQPRSTVLWMMPWRWMELPAVYVLVELYAFFFLKKTFWTRKASYTRDNHTHGDWAHIWYKLWHTYGIACLAWNEPTYLAQIWKMHRPFKEPHIWFISATVKDRLYALACRQYYGHRQEGYHSQPLSMSNNSNVPPQYNTKKYCTTCTKGIVTQNNSGSLAQSPEP